MSDRPLDVLEATVGDRVVVHRKDGDRHAGVLAGYDQHLNLVLDPPEDGDPAGAHEPVEASATDDQGLTPVNSTTIIRGDCVATVER